MVVLRSILPVQPERLGSGHLYLQSAITNTGRGLRDDAKNMYIGYFVMHTVRNGWWHYDSLNALYYFGKALRDWNRHEEATSVLKECGLGYAYRFGLVHPRCKRVLALLESCEKSEAYLKDLRYFG
jgi:hypothetical protein